MIHLASRKVNVYDRHLVNQVKNVTILVHVLEALMENSVKTVSIMNHVPTVLYNLYNMYHWNMHVIMHLQI